MTRKSKLAILVTVVAAVGLLGLRHARVVELDRAPVLSQPATAVQVAPVRRGTLESVDHVLGEVYGADDADGREGEERRAPAAAPVSSGFARRGHAVSDDAAGAGHSRDPRRVSTSRGPSAVISPAPMVSTRSPGSAIASTARQ